MSKIPKEPTIGTDEAMDALREGSTELLAQKIESGHGAIFLHTMHGDDRDRFARVVRTGDPLTRGEKRQNHKACQSRDIYILTRIFYWLGSGCPGFSNTATDTAFHRAVEDYENNIVPSAPSRTVESLYRHVWKPYLRRCKSGTKTFYDHYSVQGQSLSQFLLGLKRSNPGHEEAYERLSWFFREFMRDGDKAERERRYRRHGRSYMRDGEKFWLHSFQLEYLKAMLDLAGIQPEIWRKHLLTNGSSEKVIDEILFS